MLPRPERTEQLAQLTRQIHEGTISRRAFMARALALGLSLSAADTIFRTYRAGAQDQAENPITVTVGGTPIAAIEEDLSNATPGGTLPLRPRRGLGQSRSGQPAMSTSSIWYFMSIYDQLIRVAPDGISLVPGLAESWDVSDDGLTYTFHLRPNVLFSDGTPMTSQDVLYSWVRAANDPGATLDLHSHRAEAGCRWARSRESTTPDDATVVVELAQPWAPFLSDVAMFNMSVISKAFAEGNEERLVDECMGTGPFALGEWRKGELLRLVKNANYWEEGLPLLDEVVVQLVPDDNARILQLQGGELDGHDGRSVQPRARAAARPEPQGLPVSVNRRREYIILNVRNAPLDDVHARRALQYATDRQTLVEWSSSASASPATSFMPKGALYWNDTLEGFPYDLAKAQEELAQSATPDGFPLESQDPRRQRGRRDPGDGAQGHVEPDRCRGHDQPAGDERLQREFHQRNFQPMSTGRTTSSIPTSSSDSPSSPKRPKRFRLAGTMPRLRSWRGRARPRPTRPSAKRSTSASRTIARAIATISHLRRRRAARSISRPPATTIWPHVGKWSAPVEQSQPMTPARFRCRSWRDNVTRSD